MVKTHESYGSQFKSQLAHYQSILSRLQGQDSNAGVSSLYQIIFRTAASLARSLEENHQQLDRVNVKVDLADWMESYIHLLEPFVVHGLTNAIDHGYIRHSNKDFAEISVDVQVFSDKKDLVFRVSDHGNGIDYSELRKICESKDIQNPSKEDLQEILFEESLSTAKEISLLSGRGVGLSALKAIVNQFDGKITLDDNGSSGTTLTASFLNPRSKS